jgi:hypothetical protein
LSGIADFGLTVVVTDEVTDFTALAEFGAGVEILTRTVLQTCFPFTLVHCFLAR